MKDITKDDIRRIQNIAHSVMRGYPHHSITFDDLFQEGIIGFLEAKSRYDVTKNDYFWGFAFMRVKGSMLDYVRKMFRTIKHESEVIGDIDTNRYGVSSGFDNDYHINSEVLLGKFMNSVTHLTPLEQRLIYEYFINRQPIYKLAKIYKVKRKKVSILISSTVKYIKETLGEICE